MADWSLPTLSSLYTDIITLFRNRDTDCARMFSTAYTAATNVETGTVRWNNTNKDFEIFDSTWSALATKYLFDVDTVDGLHASSFIRSDAADSASGNLTFSGTVNLTGPFQLNGTAVTANATEINLLDNATVSTAEINVIDGDTAATATTLTGSDRFVCNDNGVMKQVEMNDLMSYMGLLLYPVGAIYCSTVSTSPATLFGGNWTAIRGRMLFAEDGTTNYVAGNEGGSKNAVAVNHGHTASANNDTHYHHMFDSFGGLVDIDGSNQVANLGNVAGASYRMAKSTGVADLGKTSSDTHGHTITVNSLTGETGANKNMSPYLAVYMWKRIS